MIYYNKDDLKAIGWTDEEVEALPEKIRNKEVLFEDFIDICQEVVEKGGAKYGLVHRPSAGHDFYDIINALGGVYYNDQNQLVFDSQGILKFFQFTYDNAQTRGITPDNLNQLGWDTINKMVGTGEAFAYYGPMFSATYVAQAAGRVHRGVRQAGGVCAVPGCGRVRPALCGGCAPDHRHQRGYQVPRDLQGHCARDGPPAFQT